MKSTKNCVKESHGLMSGHPARCNCLKPTKLPVGTKAGAELPMFGMKPWVGGTNSERRREESPAAASIGVAGV